MIVLDASVILKWLLDDEAGHTRATELREAHAGGTETIAVPDLLFFEIANVLAMKKQLSEVDCASGISLVWDFQLEQYDFGLEEFLAAMSIARRHGITVYDAAYVELARRLDCMVVTADRKLYEKTKSLGSVELL
jgi:predicted nucleic acid-binding protein